MSFWRLLKTWRKLPDFQALVAWFARIHSHDSRESGDLRESEIQWFGRIGLMRCKNRDFNCEWFSRLASRASRCESPVPLSSSLRNKRRILWCLWLSWFSVPMDAPKIQITIGVLSIPKRQGQILAVGILAASLGGFCPPVFFQGRSSQKSHQKIHGKIRPGTRSKDSNGISAEAFSWENVAISKTRKRCDSKSHPPKNRSDFFLWKFGHLPQSLAFAVSKAKNIAIWNLWFRNAAICGFIPRFFCETCGKSCDCQFAIWKRSDLQFRFFGTLSWCDKMALIPGYSAIPLWGQLDLRYLLLELPRGPWDWKQFNLERQYWKVKLSGISKPVVWGTRGLHPGFSWFSSFSWFPWFPRIQHSTPCLWLSELSLSFSSFSWFPSFSWKATMKFSIENGFCIPGPSLAAEKQGPGLKLPSENENFKPRMKYPSENGSCVRRGMLFSCVRLGSSENDFFPSPGLSDWVRGPDVSRERSCLQTSPQQLMAIGATEPSQPDLLLWTLPLRTTSPPGPDSHRVFQGAPRGGDNFTFKVLQTLYSKHQKRPFLPYHWGQNDYIT